jgi:hypothetical protein
MTDNSHLDAAYEQVKREEYQYGQAILAHERARMSQRPKPKFLLEVVNPYRARPSRSTIWDMVATALMGASWMAILFGLYLLMK